MCSSSDSIHTSNKHAIAAIAVAKQTPLLHFDCAQ